MPSSFIECRTLCKGEGDSRWLEAAVDRFGNFYLIFAPSGTQGGRRYEVEMSIKDLWMIVHGLPYEAVGDEGYVDLRREGMHIVGEFLRSGSEASIPCKIPVDCFVEVLTGLEERALNAGRLIS